MSESRLEDAPWSRQRWTLAVLAVFLLHVGLIVWFSDGASQPDSLAELRPAIHFPGLVQPSPPSQNLGAAGDPTLFALAHPKNFSGRAWMMMTPGSYRMTNTLKHPAGLSLETNQLAHGFYDKAIPPGEWQYPFSAKPSPALFPVQLERQPYVLAPSIRLDGDLSDWTLVPNERAPVPEAEGIHSLCEIGLSVNSFGRALTTRLLKSSGSPAIDLKAMEFARSARYRPPPAQRPPATAGSSMTEMGFGSLVIQWLPIPQQLENGTPRNP